MLTDNNNMKKQFNNFIEVERMLQFLDIQDVTTKRQKANGTREFKLPVKCQYGGTIHVASFASGYVRRTKAGGYCPSWQLNKRIDTDPEYFKSYEWKNGEQVWDGKYRKFTCKGCKLIPDEQDRLTYLISYCLKNYYIGYANKLSNGEFIPKWKHEYKLKEDNLTQDKYNEAYNNGYEAGGNNAMAENCTPEVKVIVNGHRYNVI